MKVGDIFVGDKKVGEVTLSFDGAPDTTTPLLLGGVDDPGPEAPLGGHISRTYRKHKDSIRYGRKSKEYEEGTPSRVGKVKVGEGEDPRGLEPHIREEAKKNNVDPDTAVAVAKSEGLRDRVGDHGTSFGAFQLHKRGGLGDEFQKETGLDPADPANEKATIAWALKNVARTGWGPYHGAARVGIGHREGIGTAADIPATNRPVGEAPSGLKGDDVAAFIVHHTGGRGTPEGVRNTLRQRGLGVEYIMDREGNIEVAGGRGSAHMKTGWGAGEGLSNRNTVGMEVIAKDNSDVTPQQVSAARAFIEKNYPNTPVYGHGEVNPGHKEADEGMKIVKAIRSHRATAKADNPPTPMPAPQKPLLE